jgi:predicted nucleic acid-binding protein
MSAPLLVADSGPLIALARLDLLALPARIFSEVLVTATVWEEVTRAPRPMELSALSAAAQAGLLNVVADPAELPAVFEDVGLDAGERSALALALAMPHPCAVLIDERYGRAAAAGAGLPVIGTLGVLVSARQRGLIGTVRDLTDRLRAGGYFLSRRLVEDALAGLGE